MSPLMAAAILKEVKVVIVTRPATDYKDSQSIGEILESLKASGMHVVFKSNIHQKFAIIDQRIVWYGSINLLGFGRSEESMMRLESSNIACELMRSIE